MRRGLSLSLDGSIAEFRERERDRDRVLGPQYSSLSELGPDILLFVSKLSKKSLSMNNLSKICGPYTSAECLRLLTD